MNVLKKQHADLVDEKSILVKEKNDLKNKLNDEMTKNQHLDNQNNQLQSSLVMENIKIYYFYLKIFKIRYFIAEIS